MKQYKPYSEIAGEPFFDCAIFYPNIEDYAREMANNYFNSDNLSDDWCAIIQRSELQPIVKLNIEDMSNAIYDWNEERFTEDSNEQELSEIKEALSQSFDFEKFAKLCPKLYYPIQEFYKMTKSDIIESLKAQF